MSDFHITAREHETIRMAPYGPLSKNAHQAFLNQIPYLPNASLTPTHDGIRTSSFCGLIQAGEWSLEILPKIYDSKEHAPERGLLVKMLGDCFDMPVWHDGAVKSNLADNLLTVIIRAFLEESQKQLTQGWIKFYISDEDRLTRPKGRLQISEQVRKGRAGAHLIYCEFDELTVDNNFNKIVRSALAIAKIKLPAGSRLRSQAEYLDVNLSEVSIVTNPLALLKSLPRHRLTQRYDNLLLLSSWILRLLGPDAHSGSDDGISLLFDMNVLFQDYVSASLERAIYRHPLRERLKLTQERPILPLVKDNSGTGRFMLKPDLCLKLDGNIVAILDTKWKRLCPDLDEHKAGISQSDVYQLLGYGYTYNCSNLSLIYPNQPKLSSWALPKYTYTPHEQEVKELSICLFDIDEPEASANKLLESQLSINKKNGNSPYPS